MKRILALLLVTLMLLSFACTGALAADADTAETGADYTTVLVHGLMGWGADDGLSEYFPAWGWGTGDMSEYISGLGYDVYVASIGPFSSAWDRCCELYAQLTGTPVDYGQAHADAATAEFAANGSRLTHARYGRDYTGKRALTDWGPVCDASGKVTGWYDNKINLVGHSFGGPTSVMFLQLLAEGNEAERAWGKQQAAQFGGDWHDYVSPLFWGDYDGETLINSVTSIAGVLNGTTFISANDDAMGILTALSAALANAAGVTDICDLYDPQLEQFGLTAVDGMDVDAYFSLLRQKGFIDGSDQAFYDLTVAGTNALKQGWETYDNVYYFSYTGDKTYTASLCGKQTVLPDADMWAILIPFAGKMCSYTNKNEIVLNVDGTVWGYADESWQPNDGMVNTVSAQYPFGAEHQDYNAADIAPGIWNVHETERFDHFEFIGGIYFPKPVTTRAFYKGVMEDIARTVPVKAEAVPAVQQQPKLDAPEMWYTSKTLLGRPILNWHPVSGACCYEVYRATSENGSYTKIGTALTSLYADLTARAKTTYYYKLVAVPFGTGTLSSDFSAPVRVK